MDSGKTNPNQDIPFGHLHKRNVKRIQVYLLSIDNPGMYFPITLQLFGYTG